MRKLRLFLLFQERCQIYELSGKGEKRGANVPADTALLTFSVSSLLCSMYSVSSKRCFLPANIGGVSDAPDPTSGRFEDEGSIPSLRSSASNLAFCASAFAASRSGSDSRYSASLQNVIGIRLNGELK